MVGIQPATPIKMALIQQNTWEQIVRFLNSISPAVETASSRRRTVMIRARQATTSCLYSEQAGRI